MKRTSHLPVLGVRATVDDLDDNLVATSLGNRTVDDFDLGAGGDEGFDGCHLPEITFSTALAWAMRVADQI